MIPKNTDEALDPSDRRQSDRKKLIVNVDFEGGDATGIANTRDIGLYITTNAAFETGMPLRMRLMLGGEEVSLKGVVAYTDPGQGIGVRFQNLSEQEETILKRELDLD